MIPFYKKAMRSNGKERPQHNLFYNAQMNFLFFLQWIEKPAWFPFKQNQCAGHLQPQIPVLAMQFLFLGQIYYKNEKNSKNRSIADFETL